MTMADQTARRPSDSFSVRLLAVLLLIRIGASVITLGGATRVQLAGGFLFRPAVPHQLRRFFFARLLFLVERHQTYVGRALAREHRPRHEAVAQFALPLRKGGRAFPVERELVVLGVMDGLAGVAEVDRDRWALRLLTLGNVRQFPSTLGRITRQTFGLRGAGVLEGTFRTFSSSPICFCRMHDPS